MVTGVLEQLHFVDIIWCGRGGLVLWSGVVYKTWRGVLHEVLSIGRGVEYSLPSARSIQTMALHPTSLRSILILSSHPRLGLPSCLFPSHLPTKILYTLLLSPIRATCPAHLSLIISPRDLLTCTDHKAPRFVVFSSPLSPRHS